MNWQRQGSRIGALAGMVLFGAVYLAMVAPGAYPGRSAQLISEQTGLAPVLSPSSPLWRGLARGLRGLPVGDLALRLNLLSVLCGVLVVGLLYRLMYDVMLLLPDSGTAEPERRTRAAAHLAAAGAVLFLGFSVPFWQVATRAHVAALDLLVLLGAAVLLLRGWQRERYGLVVLSVALFSVGTVGFATMLAFLPLYLAGLAYVLWANEQARFQHLAGLAGAVLCGPVVLLLAAWAFYGSDGYHLREYTSYGQIVWHAARDLYQLLLRGLPRTGWLIILFVSIVPWLVTLAVGRRGMNDERDRGSAILHVILTVMAVSVLLNSRFAPWGMLGAVRFLVTPYLLMAMVYGYLMAYWFLLPGRWWPTDSDSRIHPRVAVGTVLAVPLIGLLLWAPLRNVEETDTRPARLVRQFAEAVVDGLAGRTWLITDGSLDTHIQLAAYERGIALNVIAAMPQASSLYRRHTASLFDDPQLRNLAAVGVLPLLREWMRRDADIDAKLAVMTMPELWLAGGYEAVPAGTVYLGVPRGELTERLPAEIPGPYAALWDRVEPVAARLDSLPENVRRLATLFVRHTGRLANNLGVALEDAGRDADAAEAYRRARRIDPDNISALLNLAVMVEQGRLADPDVAIAAALAALEDTMDRRFEIWSLGHYFGIVRLPQAFADMGWRWALSGRSELAVARLEQALAMADADRSPMEHMLARLKLAQGETAAGAELLETLVRRHPDEPGLLLQLARERARGRDFAAATELAVRAGEAGAPALALALVEAFIALMRGDAPAVRERLRDPMRRYPESVEIWVLLCEAALLEHDTVRFEDALKRLEAVEGARGYHRSLLLGRRALVDRDFDAARGHFETALSHRPQSVFLLETLLQLSVLLRRRVAAQGYVERLLMLNQRHPFALHMLGTLQVAADNAQAAEASLRASLAERETPAVLNDLAWVLAKQGKYDEAEALSRRSLEQLPNHYAFHDTLGTILLRTGRYAEAATAFERSLSLAQHNPGIIVRMAECQFRLGNRERAEALIDPLVARMDMLDAASREALLELRAMMMRR